MSGATVRWGTAADEAPYRDVVRRSRLAAYVPIFPRETVEGVHDGTVAVSSTWTAEREATLGLLVAEAGGRITGGVQLERLHDGEGEISLFYVLPEHQGRGIGLALWEAALAAFREWGYPAVRVWAMARADWARRFYEQRGGALWGHGAIRAGDQSEPCVAYRFPL